MSRYDDTIEQIKRKNSVLKDQLNNLINDEDSTEINILKQVMAPGKRVNEDKKYTEEPKETIRRKYYESINDNISTKLKDNARVGLNGYVPGHSSHTEHNEDTFKRANREHFDKLKENIKEIKNSEFELPKRYEDDRIANRLKEVHLNDQYDKLELKKQENLLINKLNDKDEKISALENKIRALQYENRKLIDQNYENKDQLEATRNENRELRKLDTESKNMSDHHRQQEISLLETKLRGMAKQTNELKILKQVSDQEIVKCHATIKDLSIKLIMYKKANNSSHERIERLQFINRHLTNEILKDTDQDNTESLMDSTTVRLITLSASTNTFTQNTSFRTCNARMKLRVLIKMVLFVVRVQKQCKEEINFKNHMIQLMNPTP